MGCRLAMMILSADLMVRQSLFAYCLAADPKPDSSGEDRVDDGVESDQ